MQKIISGVLALSMLFVTTPALAISADITQVVFTSSEQSVDAGAIATLSTQTQNVSNTSEQVSETTTLNLHSSSNTGEFSSSNNTWSSVTSLTMASSSANRTFYYKDSTPGTHTLTVSIEGQSSWTDSQDIEVNPVYVASVSGGDSYTTLQAAVDAAEEGGTISIDKDITTSSQVTISKGLTIEGNSHTIYAPFAKTSTSNNSAIGIIASTGTVTIKNLTIDGASSTGSRHGINAFESSNIALENVTLKNNNAAGMIVGGTNVTATNLSTSGNGWGAVNVDPGDNTTIPSVFTLSSGTLAENNQIWSDGDNVSDEATVTVNADGYTMYTSSDSSVKYWRNKAPIGSSYIGTVIYPSVQLAVDASTEGQIVRIGEGTYGSFSVSGKTGVTIKGAGMDKTYITPSTLISTGITHKYTSNMLASVLVNGSTNVTIEDLTFKSNSSTPGSGGPDAIVFWNASTGSLKSCAVTGTYTINGVQTGQGIAVDAGVAENASITIDGCTISGFQKNAIDAINGNGATSGATGTTTVIVKNSTLTGAGSTSAIAQNGLVLWNRAGGGVVGTITNSTVSNFKYSGGEADASGALAYGGGELTTVSESSFNNNDLSISVAEGSLGVNAEKNWWGSAEGAGGTVSETVDADPWYMNSNKTTLSSSAVTVDNSGNASVSAAKPQVVVTSTSQEIKVSVPSGVSQASVSVSSLITSGTGSIPKITATSTAVKVEIPASTVTSANTSWDGVIKLPKVVTPSVTPVASTGKTASAVLSVEVGDDDNELTFDEPVKLTFPNQAGKLVGWSRSGSFHAITDTCDSLTSPTLDAGEECKIDSGVDLVVWTKHFTTFTAYTETTTSTGSSSSSASSGGRSGQFVPSAIPTLATNVETSTANPTVGQVLGASTFNYSRNLTIGSRGDDVTELQTMLKAGGYFAVAPTGFFGPITKTSVMEYQRANGISATGYVGPLTLAKLNSSGAVALNVTTGAPAQVAVVKAQLASVIKELISVLQLQLAAAIQAQN